MCKFFSFVTRGYEGEILYATVADRIKMLPQGINPDSHEEIFAIRGITDSASEYYTRWEYFPETGILIVDTYPMRYPIGDVTVDGQPTQGMLADLHTRLRAMDKELQKLFFWSPAWRNSGNVQKRSLRLWSESLRLAKKDSMPRAIVTISPRIGAYEEAFLPDSCDWLVGYVVDSPDRFGKLLVEVVGKRENAAYSEVRRIYSQFLHQVGYIDDAEELHITKKLTVGQAQVLDLWNQERKESLREENS